MGSWTHSPGALGRDEWRHQKGSGQCVGHGETMGHISEGQSRVMVVLLSAGQGDEGGT